MNNFITKIIEDELSIKNKKIVLRFPPEPNGYLHLGHAKSIYLNSMIAKKFNGTLNLRFDDTNPDKETEEYVEAIKKDAFWLVDNFDNIFWTSNYFDTIYEAAILLIKKGIAYVDDSSIEDIKNMRGSFHENGIESPFRNRTIEENLSLFINMKNGFYANGEKVLRAKIDMNHPNINMRDPVIYRIKHAYHHNTKDKWCIYPMYDFAHPLSDGIEGITHSLCTLEFEDHRILYNWFVEHCKELLNSEPIEIEFSKLDVSGIVLSKRKLTAIVNNKSVDSWNDQVMPTISGLRNKGITPEIIFDFLDNVGISKNNSTIDYELFNNSIRNNLNPTALRTMAIIDPVEIFIENFKEHFTSPIEIKAPLHPKNKELGDRTILLTEHCYIDKSDVSLTPGPNFWRVYKNNWIRLKYAYNLFIKDIIEYNGIIKVIAEIDPLSSNPKLASHKAKAAIHWMSDIDSIEHNLFIYDNIIIDNEFNPNAKIKKNILIHKNTFDLNNKYFEFERYGYTYFDNNNFHLLTKLNSNF